MQRLWRQLPWRSTGFHGAAHHSVPLPADCRGAVSSFSSWEGVTHGTYQPLALRVPRFSAAEMTGRFSCLSAFLLVTFRFFFTALHTGGMRQRALMVLPVDLRWAGELHGQRCSRPSLLIQCQGGDLSESQDVWQPLSFFHVLWAQNPMWSPPSITGLDIIEFTLHSALETWKLPIIQVIGGVCLLILKLLFGNHSQCNVETPSPQSRLVCSLLHSRLWFRCWCVHAPFPSVPSSKHAFPCARHYYAPSV